MPFIKNGVPVELTPGGLLGRSFPGTVTRFAHALDEATETVLTEIECQSQPRTGPGAYAQLQLEVERKPEPCSCPCKPGDREGRDVRFHFADRKARRASAHGFQRRRER